LLLNPTKHVVIECNPLIIPTLEQNRAINGCHFAIEPLALAYGSDTVSFTVATDHFMLGRLKGVGGKEVTVSSITLERILDKYGFEIINLISDSEGSEIEMVENEPDLLRRHVKWIILETHDEERGSEPIARMLSALDDLGFQIQERGEEKNVLAMFNRNLV
jgi:FkbM family methyltransferase